MKKLPALQLDDGSLELLKWIALFTMTVDHINKYLLNGTTPWMFDVGRTAMPIFVTVLAYNLARPGALSRGAYGRTALRLVTFGTLATPAFLALGGAIDGFWPLNILFTLLALTGILSCLDKGGWFGASIATAIFLIGGSLVEFWWPALALGVAAWSYKKNPSWAAIIGGVLSLLCLGEINGNAWALAALPILICATGARFRTTKFRWFFYAFYPGHLTIIWLVRIPMREAGYLFFT